MKDKSEVSKRINEFIIEQFQIRKNINEEIEYNIQIRKLRNPRDTDYINNLIIQLNELISKQQILEWVLNDN